MFESSHIASISFMGMVTFRDTILGTRSILGHWMQADRVGTMIEAPST